MKKILLCFVGTIPLFIITYGLIQIIKTYAVAEHTHQDF